MIERAKDDASQSRTWLVWLLEEQLIVPGQEP